MARPERVDILDENGHPTGELMTLTGTNLSGQWHAGVHVALYTSDRRVLLQQRSKAIMLYPGHWELGVGGVVAAGEEPRVAALREVQEEVGAQAVNLQPVTRWKYNHHLPSAGMHAKVFLHGYIAQIDPAQLRLQQSEVQDVRLLPLHEAHDVMFTHKGLPHGQLMPYLGYYRQLLSAIEAQLRHPQR
jgi:isopentenyl-diphosphate Delta-isomerase